MKIGSIVIRCYEFDRMLEDPDGNLFCVLQVTAKA
jgi:hypothetical protein